MTSFEKFSRHQLPRITYEDEQAGQTHFSSVIALHSLGFAIHSVPHDHNALTVMKSVLTPTHRILNEEPGRADFPSVGSDLHIDINTSPDGANQLNSYEVSEGKVIIGLFRLQPGVTREQFDFASMWDDEASIELQSQFDNGRVDSDLLIPECYEASLDTTTRLIFPDSDVAHFGKAITDSRIAYANVFQIVSE